MHHLLSRIENGLVEHTAGLPLARLAARPDGKWSIADVIEHLGRAFSGTAAGFHRVLAAGRPIASRPSVRSRIAVIVVIEVGYFPTGFKSPKVAEPLGADPGRVLEETLAHLRAMDDVLTRAERRFGPSVLCLDHPILGALSIRQWRRFHWIHTRHHLKQIAHRSGEAPTDQIG